jgi:hypothetical protein
MIVKIDHIAFGTTNFAQDLNWLRSLGYQAKFQERGLRDLENKRGLMHEFSGKLDMALLEQPGSLPVELLDHGHVVSQPGQLLPVLESNLVGGNPTGDQWTTETLTVTKVTYNEGFDYYANTRSDASEFRCDKLIVETADIDASVRFWSALGFKRIASHNADAPCLEFRSFVGQSNCRIYLRHSTRRASPYQLDAHGFNCLAFFSSDAAKDQERLQRNGFVCTDTNPFRVNGKNLLIFWVQGTGGEVAEIVSLAKA